MKSNLLQYYLNWNVKCYVLIILGISCLIVYVQQEYIIVPQIHNMLAVDIKTKEWLLSKFGEYRFASFVLTPLVILLRIYLVSICFYIGNILLERVHKTTTWKTYFHVSLKADFALILAPLLNCCLILYAGTDFAANIMQKTSLLYFFDVDSLDAWMVIPISLFNIFEFLYFLFVSMLLSVATNRTYRDSMNFVTSTYCTGLILYIIIVVFIVLCFIVILFICVVVGVIKYSTAHSLKQEKDIKLSTIDNEKFTMEKYYTDSKPLLIIYFHPECYFCSMEMSEMLEIKRIENFNALFITNALESEVQDFLLQYPIDKLKNATIAIDIHGEFAERFKIKAPPTIIIYDKKGKLKKIFRGAVTIKKIVKYLY